MGITCRCCGKKFYQEKGRRDKITCGVNCRVTLHRIKQKGYLMCRQSDNQFTIESTAIWNLLDKNLQNISKAINGIDENDLLIHKRENGIIGWCIFLKGDTLKRYQKKYGFPKGWFLISEGYYRKHPELLHAKFK